ncbi:hypothetical protein CRYUN_Cryun15aG0043400 [Craigia yunnanensis]
MVRMAGFGQETSSKFGHVESSRKKSKAYEAESQGGSVNTVPYMTASVSSSEFKYTFPVIPGQKFIQFYFHLASY